MNKEEIKKSLDEIMLKLEYILEADPRTMSNPFCKDGWLFDSVYETWKMVVELDKKI